MSTRLLLAGAVAGVGAPRIAPGRDLDDAYARLAAVDRQVVSTLFGAVEYAEGSPPSWSGTPSHADEPASANAVVSKSARWVVDQEPEALIHILWRVGFLLA